MTHGSRNIFTHILQSKIFLILISIATVISLIRFGNEWIRRQKISSEIHKMQAEIVRLRNEREGMSSLMKYLSTDSYIETEARNKFNLRKEGETVVVVPENTPSNRTSKETTLRIAPPVLWWNYFFGNEK